jgi:hypothetical protein
MGHGRLQQNENALGLEAVKRAPNRAVESLEAEIVTTFRILPANLRRCRAAMVVAAAALLFAGLAGFIQPHTIAAARSGGFEAADFAGTWNWMFEGKPFATMTLVRKGDQFGGSITHGSIGLDGEGKIASAAAAPGASEIVKSAMEGDALHITLKDAEDTTELWVTLQSADVAEVRFAGPGIPANFPSIRAERVKQAESPSIERF